ncbi:hypothetical protein Tco_0979506 [Tanacetum coccineum]
MANLSEDIQCAGSSTRLPMLDRTDFASWQQRIRLYCQGSERARVYSDLSPKDKERHNADIRATNILLQGTFNDNGTKPRFKRQGCSSECRVNRIEAVREQCRGAGAAGYGEAQNRVGNANPGQLGWELGGSMDESSEFLELDKTMLVDEDV